MWGLAIHTTQGVVLMEKIDESVHSKTMLYLKVTR